MEIDGVILVWSSYEENRNCGRQTKSYQKNLGWMKMVLPPRSRIGVFPEAHEEKETDNRNCEEAPSDRIRRPSEDQNELISDCPKCKSGYWQ
jgi:hypothetical protein